MIFGDNGVDRPNIRWKKSTQDWQDKDVNNMCKKRLIRYQKPVKEELIMTYKTKYINKNIKEFEGLFEFENSSFDFEFNPETGHNESIIVKHPCYYSFEKRNGEFVPIKLYHENGIVVDCYQPKCLSSENLEALKEAIVFFDKALVSQDCDDKNNYGLLFYRCGFDGRMQSELTADFAKKGVHVF